MGNDKRGEKQNEHMNHHNGVRFKHEWVDITTVMPSYKVKCLKCKRTVPCHKTWFDKSYILCPACYFKMKEKEIERFHEKRKEQYENAKALMDSYILTHPQSAVYSTPPPMVSADADFDVFRNDGRAVSENFIREATKSELIKEVRRGRLSKARARIELRRRKNAEYYANFPEIENCGYLKM